MKYIVKYFCIIFTIMLGINILEAQSVSAKTLVEKRLEAVQKEYPDESYFKEYVTVDGFSGGGCNALVMYTTLKVFHNAYVPYCDMDSTDTLYSQNSDRNFPFYFLTFLNQITPLIIAHVYSKCNSPYNIYHL